MNNLKLCKYKKGLLLIGLILSFLGGNVLFASQETEKVRVYRVQFAASKTFIQPAYFQKKFNLEDSIKFFQKDDYYKYYVGEFATEEEAMAYYHKTGDVGYVISVFIDRPVEQPQDTAVAQKEIDSALLITEEPVEMDTGIGLEVPALKEEQKEQGEKQGLTGLNILLICLGLILLVTLIVWFVKSYNRERKELADGLADDTVGDMPGPDEQQDPKNLFAFLDQSDRDLTSWDQLRTLDMIRDKNITPPDFSFWLDSDNRTIVAFCLRMIRSLGQTQAYHKVSRLLDHDSDEIRAEAVVTLGYLGNKEILTLFIDRFEKETFTNRMLILRSMARIPDPSSIDFLKGLLKAPGNLQIEAAHALASIKSFGIDGVEKALKELGQSSETIARHILINKL